MELVTGVLLIAVFISFYYYLTRNFGYWAEQGVKGPKPWPIIGTLTHYWKKTSSTTQDAENYKKFGSIFGYYEGSNPCLSVAEPELLRKILVKDFSAFPDHRDIKTPNPKDLINKFLTMLEGEEWKTVRHAMSPSFSTKKLKPFVESANESATPFKEIVQKHIESNEPLCLKKIFARFGLDAMASYALGLKVDSLQNPSSPLFIKLSSIFTQIPEFIFYLTILFPKIAKYAGSIISPKTILYLNNVIKRLIDIRLKNQEPRRHDNLDVLLKHKDILDPDAISMQGLLFLTGSDSIGTIASLICYELAVNPDCQEKLIAEIDDVVSRNKGNATYEDVRNMEYLDMVVSEILRKYPLLTRLDRMCKEDGYQLNGITLKYGTIVTIPVYSIQHDEKYFSDPEAFDPERFNRENKAQQVPFTYMPFGLGPRSCIASRLGLISAKLPLIHFFTDFRVKRTPTTEVPLKFKSLSFGSILVDSMYLQIENRTDQPQWE